MGRMTIVLLKHTTYCGNNVSFGFVNLGRDIMFCGQQLLGTIKLLMFIGLNGCGTITRIVAMGCDILTRVFQIATRVRRQTTMATMVTMRVLLRMLIIVLNLRGLSISYHVQGTGPASGIIICNVRVDMFQRRALERDSI